MRRSIPHDALIFVGDGSKALFLRNEGDAKFANFVTERVYIEESPLTHEQGTDRPGRAFAAAHTTIRSAVEPTDCIGSRKIASRSAWRRPWSGWCASERRRRWLSRRRPARSPTCARLFTPT